VTFTPTDAANYNTANGTVSITVNKANPTVTWPTAAAITYGQPLSASTLTGGTSTPAGNFAWTTPATIPTVGNSGYSVTFTPTDTANYNTLTQNVSITVNNVTITYTVTQIGGAEGISTTTGLAFTFSSSIDLAGFSIIPGDITVSGAAEKGSATFTGSGTSWTLSPITVNANGNATVSINKTGIESGSKTVAVYAKGITLTFAQITDAAGTIDITIPVLHRVSGTSTANLTLATPEQYDTGSVTWRVNGIQIGTGNSVTLNAANSANSEFGMHYLTISVKKDGVSYNKTIPFTVQY
jgi:hypothetical protein